MELDTGEVACFLQGHTICTRIYGQFRVPMVPRMDNEEAKPTQTQTEHATSTQTGPLSGQQTCDLLAVT